MSAAYQYSLKVVGFDAQRKGELQQYFKVLHPKKGSLFFEEVCDRALTEEGGLIYETNSVADAHRIAHTLMSHGAQIALVDHDS